MVITLLTDFGDRDTYAAQMKGVLAAMISPGAGAGAGVTLVDLTHHITPHNIVEAAIHLDAAVDAFAEDTIHIVVVDPGVGSGRRGIAMRNTAGTFVGPDNGVFSAVLDRYPARAAVAIQDPVYMRQPVSPTFHGRDIFAPVAAHLANGLHMTELGPAISEFIRLNLPQPIVDDASASIQIQVLLADRFGNLITNLRRETFDRWLGSRDPAGASITADTVVPQPIPLARTFADVPPGSPLAYFGSSNRLEIAIRDASAVDHLRLGPGDPLTLNI